MKKSILKGYAEAIIKTGLNVQKGQDVEIYTSPYQVEMARYLTYWAYKCGARRVKVEFVDDQISKLNGKYMSLKTLSEFPEWEIEKLKYRVDTLPCRLYLDDQDPDGMKGVDQVKLAKARQAKYPIMKPYIDQMENKYQWCIAGAAGPEWAKKVFPNLPVKKAVEELWKAIIHTARCEGNGIQNWKDHDADLLARCNYLNSLSLKELRYKSSNGTDFKVGLMKEGIFCGGAETALGSNIVFNPNMPSEEVFTSPKKGEAEGIVYATKPLSYQGELIENFSIRFEGGKAVEVHAEKGEELLKQMISMDETAAFLGECALIPFRSPINDTGILFFNTLYDENASCHLALGMGFTNCIKDYEKYEKKQLEEMGVNDSMIHVDFMIGAEDMDITGVTFDGKEVPIFVKGAWAF